MVHEGMWDPRTDVKAGLVALHHKWGEWQDADVFKWFMGTGATEVAATKHKDRQAQVTPFTRDSVVRSLSVRPSMLSLLDAFPDVPAFNSFHLTLSLHSTSPPLILPCAGRSPWGRDSNNLQHSVRWPPLLRCSKRSRRPSSTTERTASRSNRLPLLCCRNQKLLGENRTLIRVSASLNSR